ncbi:MAG: flavodoxin [Lachnospiraceae bacterium]|nr:flavodoxin [Lachnospiraceae bacterium]
MKIEVRYYTRSGNTKKLAEAIAKAVGVEAKTVEEPLREDVDILFLGSSVYAYGVDDSIKQFISNIDVTVGRVVNFSTAALIKSTYKQVGKLLAKKGIVQAKEEFYCKGSFGPMHKEKPDEKDCEAAAAFAKKIIS